MAEKEQRQNIEERFMENEIIIRNKSLRDAFNQSGTEDALIRYMMSEIMSPIEDYDSVIELAQTNKNIISDLRIYFLAAYLSSEWTPGDNYFLHALNDMFAHSDDRVKAIICYLNAHHLLFQSPSERYVKERRAYLYESVAYSKNDAFSNNRYELALMEEGPRKNDLMLEALHNVSEVITAEQLTAKAMDYWLDIQRWINEFILGTSISEEVFAMRFGQYAPKSLITMASTDNTR